MENERNTAATLFDFKQISKEVFEKRINSSEVKWEDIWEWDLQRRQKKY